MTVEAVISNSNHRERLTRNVFQANHNLSFSFSLSLSFGYFLPPRPNQPSAEEATLSSNPPSSSASSNSSSLS